MMLGQPVQPSPGEDLSQYDQLLLEVGIRAPKVVHIEAQVSPRQQAAIRLLRNEPILFGKRDRRRPSK